MNFIYSISMKCEILTQMIKLLHKHKFSLQNSLRSNV